MSFLKSTRFDRNIYGKGMSPFWILFIIAIIASMVWIALPSSGLSHSARAAQGLEKQMAWSNIL